MLNQRDRQRGERRSESAGMQDCVMRPGSGVAGVLEEERPEHERVELYSQPEWQLALRIAASKGLSKSEFLPKFLLYVCEQYLTGNTQEITEQRIGTHIFNRAAEYDPGEDNIVRSYARLLRKRLDEYFESEGRGEALRIVVPRGGYVPLFCRNSSEQEAPAQIDPPGTAEEAAPAVHPAAAPAIQTEAASSPEQQHSAGVPSFLHRHWRSCLLTVVALAFLAFSLAHRPVRMNKDASHAMWSQLFQHNRNTLIVAADSGLGILQNLTGHLVGLEEYANGTYLSEMRSPPGLSLENLNDLRRQRYTSVVDLNVTTMLTQLPEFAGSRSQIRYARGVTTEDIKNSNAILLGSPHTNPWVSLFEDKLNFRLIYTPEVDRSFVRNEHPIGAEQATYRNGGDGTAGANNRTAGTDNRTAGTGNRTYGAIAFLPSLDGGGHVLIVQGLNMAATQAAADTLFNAATMKPILQRATLPNGSLRAFELLVETSSIGATAPDARIVASRFYPQ